MIKHFARISLALLAAPALAQGTNTTAVVTPDGVHFHRATAPATGPGPATADSPAGLRWTYADPNWITENVSVGNHGSAAWLGQNLNNERYSLLATTDNDPPTFIAEYQRLGADFLRVAAADKAPFTATCTVTGSASVVEFWSNYSGTPLWTLNVGFNAQIDLSESGQFVAVGYSPTSNSAQIDVYDAFVGPAAPIAMLTATTHSLRRFDLSDDGSTVLMATQTDNHVFDVATQTQIFQDGSTVSHDAHAISRDGSAWGRGGFNPVRAWVRNGGSYNMVLSFSEPSLGFAVFTAAAISNDGTTFAAAAYDANNNSFLRVHCWDLTPTGSTLLWSFSSNGTGTLQTTPQAVSISDDGSVIAVGTWGDSNNTHDEVLLFARNGTGTPLGTVDTPGSCYDLDLSGDGQFLVIGTKSVHANTSGRGGEGYSYDLGGQELFLRGAPAIGRTVVFATEGAPGELVFLGFAGSLGAPLAIPGIGGEVLLDLATFLGSFIVGVVPPAGVIDHSLPLPVSPALIGSQFAVQALHGPPFVFTNAIRLPIYQ